MTSTQFPVARGLQQFAKEAINRAYFDIVQDYQWPWMQSKTDLTLGTPQLSGEKSLVVTENWTAIPVPNPYKDAIDWSTIYIKDPEGNKSTLQVMGWEEFEDKQEYVEGLTYVRYAVQSADGTSVGLFPLIDGMTMYYRIWTRPSRFTLDTDVIPMPDMHYQVLLDLALHHMWSFRSEVDQAQLAFSRYEKGLKRMKQKYTNQTVRARWV